MLAKTGEFKEFAQFALSSQGGSVRYMNPTKEEGKRPQSENNSKATNGTIKAEIEKEDWIPEDAYKVAHDFRNKCAGSVSKAMINTLLNDLNKIWRARETKQLSKLKSSTTREVEHLRRAVAQKKPYTAVL